MASENPEMESEKRIADMKRSSAELKHKIDELRAKTDMPVNSSLGDPAIDARNADGHNDVKDDDDDEDNGRTPAIPS